MKFNLIISNPPYTNNLDLKILKTIYELGEKICFIHPAGWLYENRIKSNLYNKIRELVKDHFISYDEVKNTNQIFKIGLFTNAFITYIDKNKKGMGNKIYDIDVHGNSEIYKSLKKKILKYNISLASKAVYKNKKNYEVGFSFIRGNPSSNDFYTFLQLKNEKLHYGKNTKYTVKFIFDSENKMLNFKEYLKLKIVRFALSLYKINQNIVSRKTIINAGATEAVPYMPTYEHKWTDEMVAKELGLTDDELAWAINWIPDYYPEDAEKYKSCKKTQT